MIDKRLGTRLRSLIRQYGIEQIDQSLWEIRVENSGRCSGGVEKRPRKTTSEAKSAPDYVAKMDYDLEKSPASALLELAKRFQDKTFLPTFGDIRNFCQVYGIDVPASKSRASAVPRVFKFMAKMDSSEIQRIVDDRLFSGPARLGPIADAIRKNGRAAAFRERRVNAG